MNEDRIIKLISGLKTLSPNAEFAAKSRNIILSSPRKAGGGFALTPKTVLTRIFDMSLSLALMSALVIAVLSGVGLIFGRSASQPQALNNSITNEANAAIKDINVHLNNVQYFSQEATKTNAVLKAAAGTPSTYSGQATSTSPTQSSSTNQNIDNLINQAAQ